MTDSGTGVPFDVTVPNVARIYDYFLGGKDNFTADRELAEELRTAIPGVDLACRQNRDFLQRVVGYLAAEQGIRQFIDIGSGLPTVSNTHEIAQAIHPDARVVYVDYDPVVVNHGRALLETSKQVTVIQGDLRYPRAILGSKALGELIDFSQPVAILLVAILHFVAEAEDPNGIVDVLKSALAPGSYLALSHATQDSISSEENRLGLAVYERASAPIVPRSHGEILKFFDGLELIEPGLVNICGWRRLLGSLPGRELIYGGAAVKE